MQPSGHTIPQLAHPMQASSFSIIAKLYPFAFTCFDIANTFAGHATTHNLQPLHLSWLTTIAPLIFAISILI